MASSTALPSQTEHLARFLGEDAVARFGGMEKVKTLHQIVSSFSCNANLCFAIDGSSAISIGDFTLMKDIIIFTTVLLGIDPNMRFAAAQFGLRQKIISSLTTDIDAFLLKIEQLQRGSFTTKSVAQGLNYCIRQLRKNPDDFNKIVIFGDGRSTFGRNPVKLANTFTASGGDICAVSLGADDISNLEEMVNDDPSRLFRFPDVLDFADVIMGIVLDVCPALPMTSTLPSLNRIVDQTESFEKYSVRA